MKSIEELQDINSQRADLIKKGFVETPVRLELNEFGMLVDDGSEALEKAAKSTGLVKKIITNKKGHRQTVWVKSGDDESESSKHNREMRKESDAEEKERYDNDPRGLGGKNMSPDKPVFDKKAEGHKKQMELEEKPIEKVYPSVKKPKKEKDEESKKQIKRSDFTTGSRIKFNFSGGSSIGTILNINNDEIRVRHYHGYVKIKLNDINEILKY